MADASSTRRRLLALAAAASVAACGHGMHEADLVGAASEEDGRPGTDTDDDPGGTDAESRLSRQRLWDDASADEHAPLTWRASWPAMSEAPDYAHAATWPIFRDGYEGERFSLTPQVLTDLAVANSFPLRDHAIVLFGLRGCRIAEPTVPGEIAGSVRLAPGQPCHFEPQCVMGVWRRGPRLHDRGIAVFQASTVPAAYYMQDQAVAAARRAARRQCGDLYSGICNLLPTGWYRYAVGCHGCGKPDWRDCRFPTMLLSGRLRSAPAIPDAFRLDGEATVLRTVKDLVFKTDDAWTIGKPFDNIHAARSDLLEGLRVPGKYSSGGCQVVRGDYTGDHTGQWARFREVAGIAGPPDTHTGVKYRYMLMTGHDAAYAAAAPREYVRRRMMRQGSSDPAIRRLQHWLDDHAVAHKKAHTPLQIDDGFGPRTVFAALRFRPSEFGTAVWPRPGLVV